jgi:hypothetical protein
MLAVAIAGFSIWNSSYSSPHVLLARAERAEQVAIDPSFVVHESYRLEVKQTSPSRAMSESSLELWSEPASERFAWRWRDDQNCLQFAEWRPGPKEHYAFTPQSSTAVAVNKGLGEGAGSLVETLEPAATVEQLNLAFVGWVRRQHWHLISITRDFASFSNHQGVAFSMRRIRSSGGHSTLILEATRAGNEKRLKLTLEIDEATGQPIAEMAHVSSRSFTVEFRVIAKQVESLRLLPASLAVFRPEMTIAGDVPARRPDSLRPRARTKTAAGFDTHLLDVAEVEVLYTLHRVELCLGAPVTVSQDRKLNLVLLTGLVENVRAREKIMSEISQLPSAKHIRVELRTFEEATTESRPLRLSAQDVTGEAIPPSPSALAIETLIDKSSLSQEEKRKLKASMAARANDFVSTTESLLRESWALKRLTHRFSLAQIERLEGESEKLISKMALDHLTAIRQQILTINIISSPMRSLITAPNSSMGRLVSEQKGEAADWSLLADSLVSMAEQLNHSSQSLFALGVLRPAVETESATLDLTGALPRFEQILSEAHEKPGNMESRNASLGTDVPPAMKNSSRFVNPVPLDNR